MTDEGVHVNKLDILFERAGEIVFFPGSRCAISLAYVCVSKAMLVPCLALECSFGAREFRVDI